MSAIIISNQDCDVSNSLPPCISCKSIRPSLSSLFSSALALAPRDRNIGGVNITTIETDFGEIGIQYARHIPASQILIVDMAYVAPVFLDIPGKGHFFVEPLAQTGAAYNFQLYGEVGLNYGPEQFHGNIHSTSTS